MSGIALRIGQTLMDIIWFFAWPVVIVVWSFRTRMNVRVRFMLMAYCIVGVAFALILVTYYLRYGFMGSLAGVPEIAMYVWFGEKTLKRARAI
jgi:hypothetical protein